MGPGLQKVTNPLAEKIYYTLKLISGSSAPTQQLCASTLLAVVYKQANISQDWYN